MHTKQMHVFASPASAQFHCQESHGLKRLAPFQPSLQWFLRPVGHAAGRLEVFFEESAPNSVFIDSSGGPLGRQQGHGACKHFLSVIQRLGRSLRALPIEASHVQGPTKKYEIR